MYRSLNFRRAVFLLAFAAALFIAACTTTEHPPHHSAAEPNAQPEPARAAVVSQIDDTKLRELLKPRGKPLLVNFWATWCGPCREEFPDLVKIDNEYRGKIDFITISLDFAEELDTGVPKFLKEMNAGMPTYLLVSADENAVISSIAKEWNGALPSTILYNATGEMAFIRQGKVNHATLKSEIEKSRE